MVVLMMPLARTDRFIPSFLCPQIDLPILMDPMVLSVLYVWCKLNKDVIVNFWFGTRFKAMYLPWVLLGMNMILSSGYV